MIQILCGDGKMIYELHTVYEKGKPVGKIFANGIGGECSLLAMMLPECIKLRNNTPEYGFGTPDSKWMPFNEKKTQLLKALVDVWLQRRRHLEHYAPPPMPPFPYDEQPIPMYEYGNDLELKQSTETDREARLMEQRYGVEKTALVHKQGKPVEEIYTLPDGTTWGLKHSHMSIPNSGYARLMIDEHDVATLEEYLQLWRSQWRDRGEPR